MYHSLKAIKYMHHFNNNQLHNVYVKELKSPKTVVTDLKFFVDGFSFPLFYVKIPKLTKMQNIIYQNSINIMQIISQLSVFSQKQFFKGNLQREIQMTNKIEGLHTTVAEITTAINGVLKHESTSNHFQPFAKMYLLIDKRKKLQIHHLSDIRNIYNHLFKTIFNQKIFPKKTMFRDNYIRIGNLYHTVYQPKTKEKDFIPDLKDWIEFINSDNYSPLIKAFIAHFFFESIHPFNDGNGRTGRYILCTYLANKIDKYTASSFSQMINKNEKLYYNAFGYLNNFLYHGDITLFLINMFTIVIDSQNQLVKNLKHRILMYELLLEKIQKYSLSHIDLVILKILLKQQIFNHFSSFDSITNLKCLTIKHHYSRYKLRKAIKQLMQLHILSVHGKKPLYVHISKSFIIKNS